MFLVKHYVFYNYNINVNDRARDDNSPDLTINWLRNVATAGNIYDY